MKKQKGNFPLVVVMGVCFTAVVVIGLYLTYDKFLFLQPSTKEQENPVVCTQEAKACPDGSFVGRTGPNCEFTQCPESPVLGSLINFTIGKQIKFNEELTVTLVEINDSRCKSGVVCVWAGELSALFTIIGGNIDNLPEEVRLGTLTKNQITKNGYTFLLNSITESTATITIIKQNSFKGSRTCSIGGCSGQICSDEEGVVSTCEYKKEYECYKNAKCERQLNGQCGWTQEPQLQACLKTK
mgnify:FL=1